MAADPDGDPLSYSIEISTDSGATWTPIGSSRGPTSVELSAGLLGSTSEALIRVVASDGLRFAADVSDATFCIGEVTDCRPISVDDTTDLAAGPQDDTTDLAAGPQDDNGGFGFGWLIGLVIAAGLVAGLYVRGRRTDDLDAD